MRTDHERLQCEHESVQHKIGEQYTDFTVKLAAMKQTTHEMESQLVERAKEREAVDLQLEEARAEVLHYQRMVGKYKEVARTAETSAERIESLEEELREKIRENHHLQIQVRSTKSTVERMTERTETQNDKIQQLTVEHARMTAENEQFQRDIAEHAESNGLLTEKLNILLKENADNTLKTERQIESIENYHLSKYKALLSSFQTVKRRIATNQQVGAHGDTDGAGDGRQRYSNRGWKKGHDDHHAHYDLQSDGSQGTWTGTTTDGVREVKGMTYAIDLDVDDGEMEENINDLHDNIKDLR